MLIVPPKRHPRKPKKLKELVHDVLCGTVIGVVIGIAGYFFFGKLLYFYAVPLVTIFCSAMGLFMGSGSINPGSPWVKW